MIAIEKEIRLNDLKQRFDILVYDNAHRPWMLVECKAIDVMLTEKTIAQMLGYLSNLGCPFVFITNGSYTYGWKIGNGVFLALDQVPGLLK